jgi:UDP-N-acetylglucosamine 2-epimerase (non-hydrolysing)
VITRARVHLIVGTRPEAIKLAPLVHALRRAELVEPVIIATGQHTHMALQALAAFDLEPDVVLASERRSGAQAELVAQLCPALDSVLERDTPDAIVVQGDTTSALVGGMVGFWRSIPVVHLEAGLRTGDLAGPFPEEANRRLLAVISKLHLAPTPSAAAALLGEQIDPEAVLVVGNTVVDAALETAANGRPFENPELVKVEEQLADGLRMMIVTAHRRESWGTRLDEILSATAQILDEHPDLYCVLPAHANPLVRAQVDRALGTHPRTAITPPLAYGDLCRLLSRAALVLSDSGGVQEETPSFRVPLLILRDRTERQEAVDGGWARLVGTDAACIVAAAKDALSGGFILPDGHSPFGDGQASRRSAAAIGWMLGLGERPDAFRAELRM